MAVEVPAAGGLVMGDVFIVGRAERATANDPEVAHHPLNAAGVLLQPSFGEPIGKAKQPELAFAVSLPKEVGERVEGTFDVRYGTVRDLDVLVPVRLWEWFETPDPDASGRPAYVEGRAF
jgi:hypothetical protein